VKNYVLITAGCILALQATCTALFALTPAEVLVIANRNAPGSVELAEYYMVARAIPAGNLLVLALTDNETCSRNEYDEKVAKPVRRFLEQSRGTAPIRCLVTVYGVPLKVAPPELNATEKKQLAALRADEKRLLDARAGSGPDGSEKSKTVDEELKRLRAQIAEIRKIDHGAALDSELTLVLQDDYPLKGWMPNPFFVGFRDKSLPLTREKTLFVSRLDGPSADIVRRVIDDSIATEKKGLTGTACFDARWTRRTGDQLKGLQGYGLFDHYIHLAADRVAKSGRFKVVLDGKQALLKSGECPDTALYVGWYSLRKYVDAFAWKPGSVGYHIASFECETLRKEGSNVWCKRMLEEGIAATIGPVAEPYVETFPIPEVFFGLVLEGPVTLVESYFLSLPFLSWQMVLLGDPLYRPFLNR